MDATHMGVRIDRARSDAKLSQRGLADLTGISQTTLSRIIAGERLVKMPEVVLIAEATGTTVAQLTGTGDIQERVQYAARSTNGSSMETMREKLLHFIELNDYLDDQGIPARC